MKSCSTCKQLKELSEFYRHPRTRDGLQPYCKVCQNKSISRWRAKNIERVKQLQAERRKRYPEQYREYRRKWKEKNPEAAREITRRYDRKHRSTASGNLNRRMQRAIRVSLEGNKAGRKWEGLVGYTLADLMSHIESNFLPGMSWNNMKEWHIDHKIPKSAFNFQNDTDIDFKKCWALTNLAPLWSFDNLSKHDKLERPFQPSLAIRDSIL